MTDLTPVEVVRCAVLYHHNVEPDTQYEAASGKKWADLAPEYQKEKYADYRAGLVCWFNRFDRQRQERWIAAAIEKYGSDARHESALHAKVTR